MPFLASLLLAAVGVGEASAQAPMRVTCVDRATGRGVPLVLLEAVDGTRWWSDSAGVVALREPEFEGREVWFHVSSPGYSVPADGFGNRGLRFVVRAGGQARVELDREMIAERLYRATGRGAWRDSLLCGDELPGRSFEVAGLVTGLDSVQCVPYAGGLLHLFGDTNRPAYPLGNFHTTAARTPLPGPDTFDPSVHLPLEYLCDESGFVRGVADIEGPGPVWLDGLCTLPDASGERVFARFQRVKDLGVLLEHGIVEWDAEEERFEKVLDLPTDTLRAPNGHVVGTRTLRREGAEHVEWIEFGNPFPEFRLPARAECFTRPDTWQCFTVDPADRSGPWHWSATAPPLSQFGNTGRNALDREVDRRAFPTLDAKDGSPISLHAGSLEWNEHRGCYVAIATQAGGEHSFLGDVWYLEADTPLGPWCYAALVAWHDQVSFYNSFQHPWFAQDGGRFVHFEGTFTQSFSASRTKVPLYDYNQLHYRVDTDDPRLALPRAVYEYEAEGRRSYAQGPALRTAGNFAAVGSIAFFALEDARGVGVPIRDRTSGVVVARGLDTSQAPPGTVPLASLPGAEAFLAAEGTRVWPRPESSALDAAFVRVLAEAASND